MEKQHAGLSIIRDLDIDRAREELGEQMTIDMVQDLLKSRADIEDEALEILYGYEREVGVPLRKEGERLFGSR